MTGTAQTASSGAFRRLTRLSTTPPMARTPIQPGVPFHRPTARRVTIRVRSPRWAALWKSGDCHSWMFASPQSPESM